MRKAGLRVNHLKGTFNDLEKLKDKYIKNKNQYSLPKDTLRTTPYKNFFVTMQTLVNKMEPGSMPTLRERLRSMGRLIKAVIQLAPSAVELIKSVIFIKQPDAQKVPLTESIFKAVKKIGEIQGVSITLEGEENLPQKYEPDTVNLFVASHRHGLNDILTVARLNTNSLIFFGAANNFIPRVLNLFFGLKNKIISRMNQNLGFIVVGKGSDPEPIEKAIKIIQETPVRNFLIFPGGRLPEGFGATMGVREKFFSEEGLISSLESKGYKVNLIPLSFPNNARLFDNETLLDENGSKELKVEVYPTIDDHTRKIISKASRADALGLLLRFGLTESLPTSEALVWGQVRSDRLVPTLDRFLGQGIADKSFCSRRMNF
jgi:hypothetical protein